MSQRSYSPSRDPRTRALGRARARRADLESGDWYVCRVRPQSAVWDHGGPEEGETEAERDYRLATLAEKALRREGRALGVLAAFVPTERLWRAHNGFDQKKRKKTFYHKPVMPGYVFVQFARGYSVPWLSVESLVDGLTIRGALTWTTAAHPEGEPRPLKFAELEHLAWGSSNPIIEAPEHHRFQKTGEEIEIGDKVRDLDAPWLDTEMLVRQIDGLKALVEFEFAGKAHPQWRPLERLEKAA